MAGSQLRAGLVTGGVLVVAAIVGVMVWRRPADPPPVQASDPLADQISCLGRISPDGDPVRIGARSISGQPSLVAELFVKPGDQVTRGARLATLNSRTQLEAAWQAAEARREVAARRLEQVRAGPKEGDLAAQRAVVTRLETELEHAQSELQRFRRLQESRAISAAEFDARQLDANVKAQQLRQAREQLNSLRDVREVDVAVVEAEVRSATAAARLARAEFDQTEIRAPVDGRVIEIHSWPGEELKPAGLLELARTDAMYVVAEVADRDIARVKPGQRATATSVALGTVSGTVDRIASQVAKKDVLSVDPLAMQDARVVEVWIRLDEPDKAAGLIHGQVTVRITP
jgi:HlyD family secretion protein